MDRQAPPGNERDVEEEIKDFVDGKSAALVKNPKYWGHDERYPKNNLPYLDRVKFVVMPDEAEAIAAMRAGKIDIIDHISPVQAYALKKTNPEISDNDPSGFKCFFHRAQKRYRAFQ